MTPPTGTRYPKDARLRKARDFQAARTRGWRHVGRQLVVRAAANALGRARLGISSPRRYGHAVRRNRFRRLVREAFRRAAPTLPPVDLLVEPRADLREPDLATVAADLEAAARRRR